MYSDVQTTGSHPARREKMKGTEDGGGRIAKGKLMIQSGKANETSGKREEG